jgi:hypothetical protein
VSQYPTLIPHFFKTSGGNPSIDRVDPMTGDVTFIAEGHMYVFQMPRAALQLLARHIEKAIVDNPPPSRGASSP